MMDKELVHKVIETARYYPSGDNSQFFRFHMEGEKLSVDYKAEEAKHALAYDATTFTITFGCLLEYLRNAFKAEGVDTKITMQLDSFNVASDRDGVAIIEACSEPSSLPNYSRDVLMNRITDRRPFQPSDQIDINVDEINKRLSFGKLRLFKDASDDVLSFFALCDSLVWTSKTLGMDIMSTITFEDKALPKGLPWQNTGLQESEVKPIKWIQKHHWLYNVLSALGAQKMMQKSQKELWASSSSFVLFSYNQGLSLAQRCEANQQLMNALLELNEQGYHFQPSTLSTDVLNFPLKPDLNLENTRSSLNLQKLLPQISQTRQTLGLDEEEVDWILRCGKPLEPFPDNARTSRLPVSTLLTD